MIDKLVLSIDKRTFLSYNVPVLPYSVSGVLGYQLAEELVSQNRHGKAQLVVYETRLVRPAMGLCLSGRPEYAALHPPEPPTPTPACEPPTCPLAPPCPLRLQHLHSTAILPHRRKHAQLCFILSFHFVPLMSTFRATAPVIVGEFGGG